MRSKEVIITSVWANHRGSICRMTDLPRLHFERSAVRRAKVLWGFPWEPSLFVSSSSSSSVDLTAERNETGPTRTTLYARGVSQWWENVWQWLLGAWKVVGVGCGRSHPPDKVDTWLGFLSVLLAKQRYVNAEVDFVLYHVMINIPIC